LREGDVEAAFANRGFRPVRATNAEIFEALLITDKTDRGARPHFPALRDNPTARIAAAGATGSG
jgi:hypothetical protein